MEFTDYTCPFCQQVRPNVNSFVERYPQFAVGFRFLPRGTEDSPAARATVAAICADEQGRFSAMHSLLYEQATRPGEADWSSLASTAGVRDLPAFEDCLQSERPRVRLEEDARLARELGISGTPTFVHSGGVHLGGAELEDFERMLASQLSR